MFLYYCICFVGTYIINIKYYITTYRKVYATFIVSVWVKTFLFLPPYFFVMCQFLVSCFQRHPCSYVSREKKTLNSSRDNIKTMKVLIGLDNLDNLQEVEKRNISNVVIHEGFKSTAVRDENDISVATLSSPVVFSASIVPICLPQPGEWTS